MADATPDRLLFWKWPRDGMAWFMWARQNYGSRWIVWRIGPLNYNVEIAAPGECALSDRIIVKRRRESAAHAEGRVD